MIRHFLGNQQRRTFYALSLVAVMGWVWFAGKDLPWDTVNYHLYAGYSVFHNRFGIDYFPAGGQTYLTPYSYAPLYLMAAAGWPSVAVAAALACIHVTIVWLTWELGRIVSRRPDGSSPGIVAWGAAALALGNPVLLQELGSSFNDVTTGALAMGGYVALASAFNGEAQRKVALAGLLLGAASALKLTNAIFALAPALPLAFGCVAGLRARAKILLIFCAAVGMALLAVGGPWAWTLWKEFGNPIFPMFDGLFNPQALPRTATASSAHVQPLTKLLNALDSVRDPRFLPSSLYEALIKPFDILAARRKIHTETMAADVRYAAIFIIPVVWLLTAWRGKRLDPGPKSEDIQRQTLLYLSVSLLVAWTLWVWISGNSRYALPMACITAVVFVAGMHRVLIAHPAVQRWVVGAVIAIQMLFVSTAAEFRWGALPWDGPWIQATIPAELKQTPFLYLSMDSQTQSILFPYLAPGSAFVGLGADVDPNGGFGRRTREMIETHAPNVRMLALVKAVDVNGKPVAPAASTFDYALRRLGLRVDTNDCSYLQYRGNPAVISPAGAPAGHHDQVYVLTCRLVPGGKMDSEELTGKQLADQILDRVESACAGLLPSQPNSSVRSGSIWRRNYSDTAAWVNDDGLVRFADLFRGGGDISGLGTAKEWMVSPPKLKCWRSKGRFYVERAEH
jgi:hypothetical protein